jgi:hypothetical protein
MKVSFPVLWAKEIAAFISLVNKRAAGMAKGNETHFPTNSCNIFMVTLRLFKTSVSRDKNFSFLCGIIWKSSSLELTKNPR